MSKGPVYPTSVGAVLLLDRPVGFERVFDSLASLLLDEHGLVLAADERQLACEIMDGYCHSLFVCGLDFGQELPDIRTPLLLEWREGLPRSSSYFTLIYSLNQGDWALQRRLVALAERTQMVVRLLPASYPCQVLETTPTYVP